jgi:hypothetical protein
VQQEVRLSLYEDEQKHLVVRGDSPGERAAALVLLDSGLLAVGEVVGTGEMLRARVRRWDDVTQEGQADLEVTWGCGGEVHQIRREGVTFRAGRPVLLEGTCRRDEYGGAAGQGESR